MTSFLNIAALCCLAACAREFRPSLTAPTDLHPSDYPSVLATWTREDQGFSGFEHKLTTKATMITPMLRAAFQKRFPEVYGYGGKITRTELRDRAKDNTMAFFLAMYAPNYRWQDLDHPDSIWHITLQRSKTQGGPSDMVLDASQIEKVKRDENLNTVFPYLSAFDQIYIVRFPLVPTEKSFLTMRIASSFAESMLVWQIEP